MSYFKAVFDLYRPVEVKIPEEQEISTKMSADAQFADPPVAYVDFDAALLAQDKALAAAQFGGIENTALLRAAEQVVDDMIRQLRLYVTQVANGDTVIILASGFRHTKPRSSPGEMPQVGNVRGGSTGIAGEIKMRWNTVTNSAFYECEVRPVGKDPSVLESETLDEVETEWRSYSTKPASIVIGGLEQLTYYEVRVRAKGKLGYGPYSNTVIVLVT